jgi:hypothetical protein
LGTREEMNEILQLAADGSLVPKIEVLNWGSLLSLADGMLVERQFLEFQSN